MVIQETDRLSVGYILESFHRHVYGRAKHDDGCTCLTNPNTTRCTIDKSLFMGLSPDIICSTKSDGCHSRDNISISQNKTTSGVGRLTPNIAPRSTDRQESRTGFSSTPSNSEASVIKTMSTNTTMHDVCSPLFGQSDNVVEPGQPELPGAANPLKSSQGPRPSQYPERLQDLNSSKDSDSPIKPKPKTNAPLRDRVRPNRKTTSNTIWGVYIKLYGKKERAKKVRPSTSLGKRLFIRLRDNDLITRNENKLNLALINFRINTMMLKFKHREVELRHWQQSIHERPNKRSRSMHPDQRKRSKNDTALNEITRECFDMGLGGDLQSGDNKALRERLRQYINIGEFCSILIKELGWGAMLIPGLLIRQDDFTVIGKNNYHSFIEYLKDVYKDWRQELIDISPVVFVLLLQGIPRGQTLKIFNESSESQCTAIKAPLNEWLYFEPATNQEPDQAHGSLYTQEEQDRLREMPCPEKETFNQTVLEILFSAARNQQETKHGPS